MAAKGSKGSKKHGRNKPFCLAYKSSNTRLRNKKRVLTRHAFKHGNDAIAWKLLDSVAMRAISTAKEFPIRVNRVGLISIEKGVENNADNNARGLQRLLAWGAHTS